MNNTHTKTNVICVHCGQVQIITLSAAGLATYAAGALMQDAFPELSPSEREMLISGTCDDCWKRFFPESD